MRKHAAILIAGLSIISPWQARGDDAPQAAPPPAATPPASPAPAAPEAAAAPTPANPEKTRSVAFVAVSRGDGVDEGLGSTIEEVLVAALSETGRFVVVDRNQIADVLKLDAQKQALGCEDKSCVANVAGAMDVQLVGSAHVGHVGTVSVVTLKLLDASSASAVVRTEETVQSDSALISAAQDLAGKAVLAIWPATTAPAAAPVPPAGAPPNQTQQPVAAQPATAPSATAQATAAQPAAPAAAGQPEYAPPPADAQPVSAPGAAPVAEASTTPSALSAAVVDLTSFEAPLAPYGTWTEMPGIGRVWRPNPQIVGPAFRPYATGGHWAYTDAGWAFMSDYDWGWAPFHYGRWWFEPAWGWVWLPGHVWSPAWVHWREGGGYLGWAPLTPNGWDFRGTDPAAYWSFVEPRYMVEPGLFGYVMPVERARSIYVTAGPMRYDRGAYMSGRWHPGPSAERVSVAYGRPVYAVRYGSVARPVPASFHAFYGGRGYGGGRGGYGARGGYGQRGGYGPRGGAAHYGQGQRGGRPTAPRRYVPQKGETKRTR